MWDFDIRTYILSTACCKGKIEDFSAIYGLFQDQFWNVSGLLLRVFLEITVSQDLGGKSGLF